jgi:hypothetical protein
VRPKIAGKHRIKFDAEALPLKDQVCGYRLLQSYNCRFGLSRSHDAGKLSMDVLLKALPSLKALKTTGGTVSGWSAAALPRRCCCAAGPARFRQGPGGRATSR